MGITASDRIGIETGSLASPIQTLEGITGRPVSNTRRALRRFFQQRLAVIGLLITGFLVGVALFAPLIAPTSIEAANLMSANQFPSATYPFGTDAVGRNELTRVIYGTRTSLIVGISAVAIACLIGIPLGLAAGLHGGWVDFAVMRAVEEIGRAHV